MRARINVYQDKRKSWRWNVAVNDGGEEWDVVCQCTNTADDAERAEYQARLIICQAWEVETDIKAPVFKWWQFWK